MQCLFWTQILNLLIIIWLNGSVSFVSETFFSFFKIAMFLLYQRWFQYRWDIITSVTVLCIILLYFIYEMVITVLYTICSKTSKNEIMPKKNILILVYTSFIIFFFILFVWKLASSIWYSSHWWTLRPGRLFWRFFMLILG